VDGLGVIRSPANTEALRLDPPCSLTCMSLLQCFDYACLGTPMSRQGKPQRYSEERSRLCSRYCCKSASLSSAEANRIRYSTGNATDRLE